MHLPAHDCWWPGVFDPCPTETLSSVIETSVREVIQRRRVQEEFIARGLGSREDAHRSGSYHSAGSVHSELQRRLDARRKSSPDQNAFLHGVPAVTRESVDLVGATLR